MEANYWYYGQIRKIILHTLRIFSNFHVATGTDKDGKPILRRVPVTFMSTDKSALYQINNATDTIIETCPKMVLTISSIKMNNDRAYNPPHEAFETEITEKRWNEETGNYEYDIGNTYSVTRFNPIPIGIEFKLFVLTTLQTQKFELFEQIRTLFVPDLELQTSENPLDWTRVTAIVMTGINYSSKGTENLDSKQLDAMDFTFEVNTNLDTPALIDRSNIIETIVATIYPTDQPEEIYGWDFDEIYRTYYTPHKSSILVKDNTKVILKPGAYENWKKLFNAYGIQYIAEKNNTYLHIKIANNKEVYGTIKFNPNNEMELIWNIEQSSLPQTNLKEIDGIIDPHDYTPNYVNGERYLILSPLGSGSEVWGTLKDENGESLPSIDANCIIEYNGENWILKTNPSQYPQDYYVDDKTDNTLWTWNDEYQCWVDVINGTFREGHWRISQM